MHGAVAVLALSLLVSALAAQAPLWGGALKFALRQLGGCALFAAAALILTGRGAPACAQAAPRLTVGLCLGALVAAVLVIVEVHLPEGSRLLAAFKVQSSTVGNLIRGSGPFEYPNIAASYLAACLPLGVGAIVALPALSSGRRGAVGAVVLSAVFAEALVATGSLAGLGAAAVSLGLLVVAPTVLVGGGVRRMAGLGAVTLVTSVGGHLALDPDARGRLVPTLDAPRYGAAYRVEPVALVAPARPSPPP